MAFLPNSTIYLCRVPFDSTQKNQVYFTSPEQQREYFITHQVDLLISYNIVRKTLANGSMQSSIRVANRIDDLRTKGVNYLCYQNAQHGAKWFYCFVEQLVYVSENCTEIIFETDVFQTWLFDTKVMDSFIVREHSATDEVGDNIVPESFAPANFVYKSLIGGADLIENVWLQVYKGAITPAEAFTVIKAIEETSDIIGDELLDDYAYLICASGVWVEETDETYKSENICGVPQGYTYAVAFNTEMLNKFLNELPKDHEPLMVVAIPRFSFKEARIYDLTGDAVDDDMNIDENSYKEPDDPNVTEGQICNGSKLAEANVCVQFSKNNVKLDTYTPKNNKLYTAPYFCLNVTNHNGIDKDYPIEYFPGTGDVKEFQFTLTGDISPMPSVYLIPNDFMGVGKNYDQAITLSDFPQISFNSDSYKLWLARNQGTLALQTATGVGNMIIGGATSLMGNPMGPAQLGAGAMSLGNTIASAWNASKEPDSVKGGSGKNYLLLASKQNKFRYRWKSIRKDYAKAIDDYFTMYGYAINNVKKPYFVDNNSLPRKSYYYIETREVNITGRKDASGNLLAAIPNEDMEQLKSIYNNGVTLWNPGKEIGNYALNNECVGG